MTDSPEIVYDRRLSKSHRSSTKHDRRSKHRDDDSSDYRPFEVPERLQQAFDSLPISNQAKLVEFEKDDLPLFENLAKICGSSKGHGLSAQELQDRFFEDIREGDKLLVRVRSANAIMLDVEMLCMVSRFRRLLQDAGLGRFKIMHDRTDYVYHTNDIIEVIVDQVLKGQTENSQKIKLKVLLGTAPIQPNQAPLYYRTATKPESDEKPAKFEEIMSVQSMLSNPSANYALGFPRRIDQTVLPKFRGKTVRPVGETIESLKELQLSDVAKEQITKAGNFIKDGRNFEAIQACNMALKNQPDHLDALLGRAIAAHNMDNIESAIIDLEKILSIKPEHERATKILAKVLVAKAEEAEDKNDKKSASQLFSAALKHDPSLPEASEGLERCSKGTEKKRKIHEIDLTKDESKPIKRMARSTEEMEENRRKLAEIEKFKQRLMKTRK
ncbi:unnamed protein product [Bursaphelenchus okinawaensis]|uniref:TPR_REGION domain-containing protein n=1 Tax=Bursaphelenchus okinawaensis TaxID=465554 RepID=A0A811JX52_9BILA|nr:unnamed protein product [Bursaphelenchus okinawaensis]CAG9086430.1 unnamed protein product [Bursaphelenchus okinawaensis]